MRDRGLIGAALVMLAAVALGAFGAHGLKEKVSPDALAQWHTGVLYQMVHGLALFALFVGHDRIPVAQRRWAYRLFIAGVFAFSGSLYLLSTREPLGIEAFTPVLGPITPLGGLCFIGGWAMLVIAAVKRR